jgi:hypothetical protein
VTEPNGKYSAGINRAVPESDLGDGI